MGKKLMILIVCFAAAVLIVVFIPSFSSTVNPTQAALDQTSEGMFQQKITRVKEEISI